MMKRTLLATCLSMALVLSMAASGFASIWDASAGVGTEYTKSNPAWTSGNVVIGASSAASLTFTFDYIAKGSWDGATDTVYTKPNTLDMFTINIYRDGTLIGTYNSDVDNPDLRPDGLYARNVHLEYLLPNIAGTYTFEAISKQTATDESWILSGASVNPTPLPAAVWMLGSALLGAMGFKTARRKNGADA